MAALGRMLACSALEITRFRTDHHDHPPIHHILTVYTTNSLDPVKKMNPTGYVRFLPS